MSITSDQPTADVSQARAAIQEAIAAFVEMWRAAMPIYLARQRHRSRIVTRRKQRSRW